MSELNPEQLARVQIDEQLRACGWVIQNYRAVDFSAESGIALREVPLKGGPCDYLLLVNRKAIGVIEAKKAGTPLSAVADQSARYASSRLPDLLAAGATGTLPFLYESNGNKTFFRDSRDPDSRSHRFFAFHRPEILLESAAESDTLCGRLTALPVVHPLDPTGMRDCQVEAIKGLEDSFAANRTRDLMHSAMSDFSILGERHRSIYTLWRQVIESGAFIVSSRDPHGQGLHSKLFECGSFHANKITRICNDQMVCKKILFS